MTLVLKYINYTAVKTTYKILFPYAVVQLMNDIKV